MLPILQSTTVLLFCIVSAFGTTVGKSGTLKITSKQIAPDGFLRPASVVNDIHPGPVITINKGDTVKMNVVNQLSNKDMTLGTSIHWHGIGQGRTNFMDGVSGVTQCPIAPGNSFEYAYHTPTPGTYWYHSHFRTQYCDGVRGPLIIYDPEDPHRSLYDIDDESTVITLMDWYHIRADHIVGIPFANSTLINGKGRYPDGPKVELSVINVCQGKRYRFRLISMACEPNHTFSIDGHNLTIIEADETLTQPHTVNSIQILAGQRYSFVLHANQKIDNYRIRALPDFAFGNLSSTFEGGVNSAILRYAGAPDREPTTHQQAETVPLIEADLHPATSIPPPGEQTPDGADETFTLSFDFNATEFKYYVNGTSYVPPTVPVLLQILSGTRPPQGLLPAGSVYTVERNKTIQVNVPAGLIGGPHPFHMHGHTYWVVRSADTNQYNFNDPITRDTVSSGNTIGDFVSIRFRTDNPGPWMFHCHLDFHLKAGLAIVFAEAPDRVEEFQGIPPDEWDQLCPTWNALPSDVRNAGNI